MTDWLSPGLLCEACLPGIEEVLPVSDLPQLVGALEPVTAWRLELGLGLGLITLSIDISIVPGSCMTADRLETGGDLICVQGRKTHSEMFPNSKPFPLHSK